MDAGATIGAYRILGTLGQGGMGTVYLAEHVLLGRRAAIKVLVPAFSTNEEVVQRFFNEARAVTQISDPGIVQIFDFGHDQEGHAFIVMELLEGEALDRRLERLGKLGVAESVRLMRMTCASLGAAHAKGIVHRDLKPENLFIVGDPAVTGGERVKVLDFGIAKLTGNEPGTLKTRSGVLMGTPVYMSPEQCRGTSDIDHRSDIYSMACVAFTMLTGQPPFDGAGSGDLIVAHMREPAPLASSRAPLVPAALDQVLQRCMAKAAADRYRSMAELVEALDAIASSLASTTLPPTAPSTAPAALVPSSARTTLGGAVAPVEAWPGPTPGRRGLIVAGIGAAAIGAAVLVWASRGAPEPPARPPPLAPAAVAPVLADARAADASPADAAMAPAIVDAPIDAPIDAPADAASDARVTRPPTRHPTSQPRGSNDGKVDRGD